MSIVLVGGGVADILVHWGWKYGGRVLFDAEARRKVLGPAFADGGYAFGLESLEEKAEGAEEHRPDAEKKPIEDPSPTGGCAHGRERALRGLEGDAGFAVFEVAENTALVRVSGAPLAGPASRRSGVFLRRQV